jgi:exopolysaccharide biosynthesis polyprenyl glycosylphosphotransferase
MNRRFSVTFGVYALFLDALLVMFNLYLANWLRPWMNALPLVKELDNPQIPLLLYPVLAVLWVVTLMFFSVYDGRRNLSLSHEILNLGAGALFAGIASAGVLYFSFRDISRLLFLVFVTINSFLLIGWRLSWRRFGLRPEAGARRVLIAGDGPVAREIGLKILADKSFGLSLAGFAHDGGSDDLPGPTHGTLAQVPDLVQDHAIDEVLIALEGADHPQVARLILALQLLPVKVWVVPEFFQLALFRAGLDEFAGIPMLDLRASAITEPQRIAKRTLDLLVAIPVLALGLPVMALACLAIWLDSGRPLIFKQKRVGENGRLFNIFKFRTMVPGAQGAVDELGWGAHKRRDDPRVTRVGRFLRRTSLDELPQFFNVLLGNMSLVGPRPELPEIVARYEPWQHQRFVVPPGITGWWQITGRSEKLMHRHTHEDIYYIENYSILLDLRILLRTVGVVLGGKGAF